MEQEEMTISKPNKRPLVTMKSLTRLAIGVLLLWLGGVIGVRYAVSGELPFGLQKLPLVRSSITLGSSQAERLIGESNSDKVDFDAFWEVWGILEQEYLEPEKIEAQQMVDGAISGMTASLGDPYTVYLPAEDNQRSSEDLAGKFYGVGIELGYIDSTLAVVAPLANSPAETAGVQAGDLILHVKDDLSGVDEDTTGWSLDEAVNNIRGGKGEPVYLTLFRPNNGGESFVVEIIRDEIVVESVKLEFVDHAGKKVAHLRLLKFGQRTLDEWSEAVTQINAQQDSLTGIVLDLRNNPGGFFDTSIDVAGDFFRSGTVVSQQGKFQTTDFTAKGRGRLADYPVVVLVNRGSASASEIVAGALRDNIGAKLVGEQTFGKGTVQDRIELSNGGGLHVTIGRWLMPQGEWIHDEGIPVDVEAQNNPDTEEDEVLLKGIEEL